MLSASSSKFVVISMLMLLFIIMLPYGSSVESEVSEQDYDKTDPPVCVYHHLLLIYPNVDVVYYEEGSVKRFSGSMSGELLSTVILAFKDFNLLIRELTNFAVLSTYEYIVMPNVLTKLTCEEGLGCWPSPRDVEEDLSFYAPYGTFDSVFVVWYNGPIRLGYFGLGGMFINNETTIYSVVASYNKGVWEAQGRPGEVFLHEWLHGVARFYSSLGYVMPEGDADGAEIHGYVWTSSEGWTPYYRDLMQGRVWESKLGMYTGIPLDAWSRHCSPNIERLKTSASLNQEVSRLRQQISRLIEENNALRENYENLSTEYSLLKSSYNILHSNYDKLKSAYDSLSTEYDRLSSRLTTLEDNYNRLLSDYNILSSKYDDLMNSYKKLSLDYSSLKQDYEKLRSEYASLKKSYEDLSQEHLLKEYEATQYKILAYVFGGATIVSLIGMIVIWRLKPRRIVGAEMPPTRGRICPSCGHVNEPAAKYCASCGSKLEE